MFMNYTPLWIKTDYSILTSLIKIDDLINMLSKEKVSACAICDDNLFGTMEFYNKCKKKNIKPIIGLEVNIGYTILLYVKNYHGYQNLCNISTLYQEKKLDFKALIKYISDLVVVLPFKDREKEEDLRLYADDLFIGYGNASEKDLIEGGKVFIKKTLCLNNDDEKYLKYLYKIKETEFEEPMDVSMPKDVLPEDKKTTMYLSELCNLEIPKQNDLLPVYNDDPSFDEKKYLTDLCIFGLKKRLNGIITEKYVQRLKHELNIIIKMGFCNYFLVVWDYVKYAKKNNIMVNTRGSAASSLVSYSLGITDIDPIKYDLLFERFLNPQRVTMPDIDVDFDAEKRDDVINYVIQKYGKNKVSGIITFSNLLAKQVIRDVARIFEISNYKVDNLLKNFDDKKDLSYQLNNINVKRILNDDEELSKVYDVSLHLEGLKRHTSVHAAGIIISNKNLSDYVPLALNSDGTYLCGYTMNYIEELGLLKMDFLGLKNLSVIDKIIKRVGNIKFSDIPLDDKKTFELFSRGDLDGIFQFESAGMRKFISELKPEKIDDLIAAVALYRPGPMQNIPSYVARRHGKEKITYLHDDLKEILSSTYGIIIYQEQIMQIAVKMAGFSYGEADELRRAMSKKKEDVLLSYKKEFINGSMKKGYTKEVSEEIYNLILKFANYGFNKAHSVSYAIVGYKIAYLKVHYPLYFECEILNNYIGLINKTKNSVNECKRLGVEILNPKINISTDRYEIRDDKLIFPLSLIKGIGTLTARSIVKERCENGNFSSYLDFVRRCYKFGKDVLRNLILSGALDGFGKTKKTLIENLDDAINYAELCNDLDESLVFKPEIRDYEEYTKEELTKYEIGLFGFYISNHPTSKYITDNSITTDKLERYFDSNVRMTLYIERKKEIDTKAGEKMMFLNATDSFGMVELVMFPKTYNKFFNIPIPGVYKIKGKVEKRFSKLQIVLYDVEKVWLKEVILFTSF